MHKTTPHIPLSLIPHGFQHYQTNKDTPLSQNTLYIVNNNRVPQSYLLLTTDISETFDVIPRLALTNKILNKEHGCPSNEVPYNYVLSMSLSNLYKHDILHPPPSSHIASYADNVTITHTHTKPNICSQQSQSNLDSLSQLLTQKILPVIPTTKPAVLLLTTNTE